VLVTRKQRRLVHHPEPAEDRRMGHRRAG
jgi:hypothetical protein